MKERGYRGSCRIHEDVLSSENSLSPGTEDRFAATAAATAEFAIAGLSCAHRSGVCQRESNAAVAASCAPPVSLWACGGIVLSPRGWSVWVTRCGREAPRQIGDDRVERAVRLTLEEAPKGATHWSSRALAARTGLSQSTVSRIWRAFGCVLIAAKRSVIQ